MRAPLQSWAKSDSVLHYAHTTDGEGNTVVHEDFVIGEKDKELSIKLQKAGSEHCKHLRMIQTWFEITAPLFWLKQIDTYRIGVEKVSTSTMHTLMNKPLTKDNFEHGCMNDEFLNYVIDSINTSMEAWRYETDPEEKTTIWRSIIEALPESYLQKRIYMFSYAALRNIVRQREGHKLSEWKQFIDFCRTLPNNWMIFE